MAQSSSPSAPASRNPCLAARLRAADIEFPERFSSISLLEEILRNREAPRAPGDTRPLAVFVYPKVDKNGAFAINNLGPLIKGYRVIYREVSTDTGFVDALKASTKDEQAALLVIGGHGDKGHTVFGAADPQQSVPSDEAALDLADEEMLAEANVGDAVAHHGVVMLRSCSTGTGAETSNNIANLVASVFPHAHVYAPTQNDNAREVVDAQGKLVNPGFFNGPAYTYHVEPFDLE